MDPNPDFILWLGDNYGHLQHDTEDLVLGSTQLLAQRVAQYFTGVPVVAAVGNHDTWPYNSDPGPAYYAKLAAIYSPWLNTSMNATAKITGSYANTVLNGLRVISLNTQHLAPDVLTWFESSLAEAASRGERA